MIHYTDNSSLDTQNQNLHVAKHKTPITVTSDYEPDGWLLLHHITKINSIYQTMPVLDHVISSVPSAMPPSYIPSQSV